MNFPKVVLDAARAAEKRHPNNPCEAVREVWEQVKDLPEYETFRESLEFGAIQQAVYHVRRMINAEIRSDVEVSGGGESQPVRPSLPPRRPLPHAVADAYNSIYEKRILSRRLGDVKMKELADLADRVIKQAAGHAVNGLWLRALAEEEVNKKNRDRTVEQVVSEERLKEVRRNAVRKARLALPARGS